jgi:hypothetical protein
MIGQVRAQDTLQLVRSYQVLGPENVSALSGLGNNARYGGDVCRIGDLNNDGVTDLLVGHGSHPNGSGAAWIHFMAANGTVQSTVLLSSGANGMPNLNAGDNFGARVADLGDLDLDGVEDIAVLAPGDDAGGTNKGAVHICFLNTNGTIKSKVKITAGLNGFTGSFINGRCFDADVAEVGDMNQDGITDLAVGSSIGDDGGTDRGGVWILLLNTNGTVKGNRYYASNSTSFPWPGGTPLANNDLFGFSVCKVGDLNADGIADLAVAARFKFNVTGQGRGRIFLMYLNANGTIASYTTIGPGFGGFPQVINGTGGHFGWSIDNVGDLNGDGTTDLLASARQQNVDYTEDGAAYIIYLKPDGTVHATEEISENAGLGGTSLGLHNSAWFGFRVAALGDLDGDHVMDIAVSANGHNGGGIQRGRIYVMELNPKPLVASITTVAQTDSLLGSIQIKAVGGVRPYQQLWGEGFPTPTAFQDWKQAVAQVAWDSLGIPEPDLSTFDRADLALLTKVDTDLVRSGSYTLLITDAAGDSLRRTVDVGYRVQTQTQTGVLLLDQSEVQKTTPNGWTNMQLVTQNILGPQEDGWMTFSVPQTTANLAMGLRPYDVNQLNGFEQMDHAFVFTGSTYAVRQGQGAATPQLTYNRDDRFKIKLRGTTVFYMQNDAVVFTGTLQNEAKAHILDLAMFTNGAWMKEIKTDFKTPPKPPSSGGAPKSALKVSGRANPISCDGTGGSIDHVTYSLPLGVSASNTSVSWQGSWQGGVPTWTGQGYSVPGPGTYTLTLTITGTNGLTYQGSATFTIGYAVDWVERVSATTPAGATNTLHRLSNAPTEGRAASGNETDQINGSWHRWNVGSGLQPCGSNLNVSIFTIQSLMTGDPQLVVGLFKFGGNPIVYVTCQNVPGNQTGILVASETDDVHLEVATNDVVLSIVQSGASITLPGAAAGMAGLPYRGSGTVLCPTSTIKQATFSYACREPQRALLEDDLREGYHRTDRKKLLVGYWEDYNDTQLDYAIHAMDGNVVISSLTQPKNSAFGYNELTFDLLANGTELAEGFYWMEITNGKGIKQYLRFFYDSSLQ